MASVQNAPVDRLQRSLAGFACGVSLSLTPQITRGAKVALMDTLAVALGALRHPAALAARRYARISAVPSGATVWGSGTLVTAECAALVNGVPLRGYDYNDLYSNKAGGHPSDMIPGLIALAEWRKLSGSRLLEAIALGYDITVNLFDTLDNHGGGWDYPTTVMVGTTCAAARLLGLSEATTREALAIAVTPHFASLEAESSELNSRGDLTLWKRFNGSDATRQAVYACLLAECGVEGVVRPFEGKHGFLKKYGSGVVDLDALFQRLDAGLLRGNINSVVFKRWPVGSRGQSAIQAALEARGSIDNVEQIKFIKIFCDDAAYDHLVRSREDPWQPNSRETADHSLPYIVATAVLDGFVRVESFDLERVLDAKRRQFLIDKVTAEPCAELAGGAKKGFLARVEIVDAKGQLHIGAAMAPPGHPNQPFSDAEFEQKLVENVAPLFGEKRANEIIQAVWSIETMHDLGQLTRLCVLQQPDSIDLE
ncbi:MAG: MmgE/PrpD family protein [Burkholderiales bacterium]